MHFDLSKLHSDLNDNSSIAFRILCRDVVWACNCLFQKFIDSADSVYKINNTISVKLLLSGRRLLNTISCTFVTIPNIETPSTDHPILSDMELYIALDLNTRKLGT